MNSLRRTLLVSLLSAIVVIFAIGGYLTYRAALVEADELMDYQLRQFALSLRDQHFSQPMSPPIEAPEESLDFVIQIWDSQGVRLYLSHPHSVLPDLARFGYNTVDTSEGQWRVFSIPLRNQVIQVAQPMKVRSRIAADAALRTLIPTLTLMPLLGVLIWLLVGRGLRPLDRLAREVGKRRPDSLEALPQASVPDEARPLVAALNDLLQRLDHALTAQRAFVADAAHELRTPLAALQIQLQLTERANDESSRRAALAELRSGLQRATHLVQQLLTLARQEPDAARPLSAVALADIARQALADHAALAHDRGVDLGANMLDDTITVAGDAAALRTLVGNLVDNAIRYTPPGGKVDVSIRPDTVDTSTPPAAVIEVGDSGPGIPPEDHERVLARFYRREGTEQPGSGLGLAIVTTIARRHGAALVLGTSPLGGLLASVHIPLQPQPPLS
ncbi:HAMP domain-containing protein [Azoarcus sp. L1K30]|uniref:ATP-binding protein n=1 Tax=Azoarcus sp. L1K30 TaxID=2820277 RepID=UPI001B839B56|nr:ATP-binding protein [Azoarcus sp. L1K30]MBR0565460.1 HAMP domain-containing protein [Azoarcus sp. L1K30]